MAILVSGIKSHHGLLHLTFRPDCTEHLQELSAKCEYETEQLSSSDWTKTSDATCRTSVV